MDDNNEAVQTGLQIVIEFNEENPKPMDILIALIRLAQDLLPDTRVHVIATNRTGNAEQPFRHVFASNCVNSQESFGLLADFIVQHGERAASELSAMMRVQPGSTTKH